MGNPATFPVKVRLGAKAKDVVDHNPLCVVDGATKSDCLSVYQKTLSLTRVKTWCVAFGIDVEVLFSLELGSRERAMLGVKTKGGPRFVTFIQV